MSESSPAKEVPTQAAVATADEPKDAKVGTPDTNATDVAKPAPGEEEEASPEEEVTKGNWNLPQVDVKAVDVVTGEEDEECVWKHRSKLYRWVNGEWKERGLGESKLLKDKAGKTRFLLRQEKTGKLVANHYVVPKGDQCKLKPNAGSDKCWVWSVLDCSDETPEVHQFALMFGQAENAKKFKEEFEAHGAANLELFEAGKF
eukprot:Gregarina_sp_Pseudo_9__2374@NODE_267_length_3353_cov_90_294810_g250_i0_p2_GENE_NODE_267_length_3353_cov_90_294810_g250_i0NODE_267_length_3353_cov_90_294810_g250_i0_p2_ORF_typecomplete_len202_score29_84Ran_BP1/PF00638_18/3_7e37WH1/PF00568_23/0_01SH3_10/PF17902_1/3_1_NODE_267_length_3353_cov_90_294810_g250_i026423247